MKITALVENTTVNKDIKPMHGLSLYIETKKHKLLVDTGSGVLFLKNAESLGVDIAAVDTLIITHGHSDHGGGLDGFLNFNKTAKVYLQSSAFYPHYSKVLGIFKADIGLDKKLKNNPQIVLVDGDKRIDDELFITANPPGKKFMPKFNKSLLERRDGKIVADEFTHEQSVIILADKTVLIGGCAHRGIINILEDAEAKLGKPVDVCISGFHMFNPVSKAVESADVLTGLAAALKEKSAKFYTCHCTGLTAYKLLKNAMCEKLDYLSAGQTVEI